MSEQETKGIQQQQEAVLKPALEQLPEEARQVVKEAIYAQNGEVLNQANTVLEAQQKLQENKATLETYTRENIKTVPPLPEATTSVVAKSVAEAIIDTGGNRVLTALKNIGLANKARVNQESAVPSLTDTDLEGIIQTQGEGLEKASLRAAVENRLNTKDSDNTPKALEGYIDTLKISATFLEGRVSQADFPSVATAARTLQTNLSEYAESKSSLSLNIDINSINAASAAVSEGFQIEASNLARQVGELQNPNNHVYTKELAEQILKDVETLDYNNTDDRCTILKNQIEELRLRLNDLIKKSESISRSEIEFNQKREAVGSKEQLTGKPFTEIVTEMHQDTGGTALSTSSLDYDSANSIEDKTASVEQWIALAEAGAEIPAKLETFLTTLAETKLTLSNHGAAIREKTVELLTERAMQMALNKKTEENNRKAQQEIDGGVQKIQADEAALKEKQTALNAMVMTIYNGLQESTTQQAEPTAIPAEVITDVPAETESLAQEAPPLTPEQQQLADIQEQMRLMQAQHEAQIRQMQATHQQELASREQRITEANARALASQQTSQNLERRYQEDMVQVSNSMEAAARQAGQAAEQRVRSEMQGQVDQANARAEAANGTLAEIAKALGVQPEAALAKVADQTQALAEANQKIEEQIQTISDNEQQIANQKKDLDRNIAEKERSQLNKALAKLKDIPNEDPSRSDYHTRFMNTAKDLLSKRDDTPENRRDILIETFAKLLNKLSQELGPKQFTNFTKVKIFEDLDPTLIVKIFQKVENRESILIGTNYESLTKIAEKIVSNQDTSTITAALGIRQSLINQRTVNHSEVEF